MRVQPGVLSAFRHYLKCEDLDDILNICWMLGLRREPPEKCDDFFPNFLVDWLGDGGSHSCRIPKCLCEQFISESWTQISNHANAAEISPIGELTTASAMRVQFQKVLELGAIGVRAAAGIRLAAVSIVTVHKLQNNCRHLASLPLTP